MTRQTQAEIFISTLEELRDDNRVHETTRMRSRIKAHALKFMETFSVEVSVPGSTPRKPVRRQMTARRSERASREDGLCTFSFMTREHP